MCKIMFLKKFIDKIKSSTNYYYNYKFDVIGIGGHGFVIEPGINNNTYEQLYDCISKIIILSKSEVDLFNEICEEFRISNLLLKYDRDMIYFLGGFDICQLDKNILYKNISVIEDIDLQEKVCMSKSIFEKDTIFINIIMKKGYDFYQVFSNLNSSIYICYILYHLINGIRICIKFTNYVMMDIKLGNLLFINHKENYICPVFIDFTRCHILDKKRQLHSFIDDFSKEYPKYYPWSPELKIMLVREYYNRKKYRYKYFDDYILNSLITERNYYNDLMKTNDIDYQYIKYINPYSYFYGSTNSNINILNYILEQPKNKIINDMIYINIKKDLLASVSILEENCYSSYIDPRISEKMMIYQLGKVFHEILLFHFIKVFEKKQDNIILSDKLRIIENIHSLIMLSLHPNIHKRPSCNYFLEKINKLVNIENNGLIDIRTLPIKRQEKIQNIINNNKLRKNNL